MDWLIWLAALPGIVLIRQVYRLDKIEKEPFGLLLKLIILGALITIPVSVIEMFMDGLLLEFAEEESAAFSILENFIGVALIEEYFKYLILRSCTWKHPAFNYRFDAIVYAVCVSMGFAILENILYVSEYGLSVAIMRMLISVPAHCIFAIYMGHYYGQAKTYAPFAKFKSWRFRCLALWIPVLLHGFFDWTASSESDESIIIFLIFVILMDIVSIRRIRKSSKTDIRL